MERALAASNAKEERETAAKNAEELATLTKEGWKGATLREKREARYAFEMRFTKAKRAAHPPPSDADIRRKEEERKGETPAQRDARLKKMLEKNSAKRKHEDDQLQTAYKRFISGDLKLSDSDGKWFSALSSADSSSATTTKPARRPRRAS
mgnify:FL=1